MLDDDDDDETIPGFSNTLAQMILSKPDMCLVKTMKY